MIRRSKSCTNTTVISPCWNTTSSNRSSRHYRRIVRMLDCNRFYHQLLITNNSNNFNHTITSTNNSYRFQLSSLSLSLMVPSVSFVSNNNNNNNINNSCFNCFIHNNRMLGTSTNTNTTVQWKYSILQSPTVTSTSLIPKLQSFLPIVDTLFHSKPFHASTTGSSNNYNNKNINRSNRIDNIYFTKRRTRNWSSFSSSSSIPASTAQRNFSSTTSTATKTKTISKSTITGIEKRNDVISKRMYRILLRLCNDLETYIKNNQQSLHLVDRELLLLKSLKHRRQQQQQQQQQQRKNQQSKLTTTTTTSDDITHDKKFKYQKRNRLSLLRSQLLQEEEQEQQLQEQQCQFLLQRPIDPTEAGTYRLLELIPNSNSNSESMHNDSNNNSKHKRTNSSRSSSSSIYESNVRQQDDDDLSTLLRYLYLYDYTKPDTYDDSFFSSDEDSDDDDDDDDGSDDDSDSDSSDDDDDNGNNSSKDNDEQNISTGSNSNKDVKKAKQKTDENVVWKDLIDGYKEYRHNNNHDDDDDDIDDIDSVLRLYKYKNEFLESMNHTYNNDHYNNSNNNNSKYDMDDTFDNDDYDNNNNFNANNSNNSNSNNGDIDRVERENNVIAGFVLHLMENEYNLKKIIEDIDSDDNENASDDDDNNNSDIDSDDNDSDDGDEYSFVSQQRAIEFEEKQSYYNTIINERYETNNYSNNNNDMKIHPATTTNDDNEHSNSLENDDDDDNDSDDIEERTERQRQSDNILNDFDNYEHVTLLTSVNKIRSAIRYVFRKSKYPIVVVPAPVASSTTTSTDNSSTGSTGTYNIVSKATKMQYALEAYRLLKQQLVYVLPNTSISYDQNVQITIFTQYIGKSTGDSLDWGSSRNHHSTTSTTSSSTSSTGSNEKRGNTSSSSSSSSSNVPYYYESAKYLYAYRIRIENHSLTDTIQLLGRKWDIYDSYLDDPDYYQSNNIIQEQTNDSTTSTTTCTTGAGDVLTNGNPSLLLQYKKKEPYRINVPDGGVAGGQQPILLPGSVFEYISGAEAGECGLLKGNFYFTKINNNTNHNIIDSNAAIDNANANAKDNSDDNDVIDNTIMDKENIEKRIQKKKKQQQQQQLKIQQQQSKKLSRKDQFEVHVAPVKLISVL